MVAPRGLHEQYPDRHCEGYLPLYPRLREPVEACHVTRRGSVQGAELISRLTADEAYYDTLDHWKLTDFHIRRFKGLEATDTIGYGLDTNLRISPADFLVNEKDAGEDAQRPALTLHRPSEGAWRKQHPPLPDGAAHRYAAIFSASSSPSSVRCSRRRR